MNTKFVNNNLRILSGMAAKELKIVASNYTDLS